MAVSISVLILAIFDAKNSEALNQRERIGKSLIIMNMVFNFLVILFMLFGLFMRGWEIVKHCKSCYKQKKLQRKALPKIIYPQDMKENGVANLTNSQSETTMKTHLGDTLFQRNTLNEQVPESSIPDTNIRNDGIGGDNSSFLIPNHENHSPILSARHEGIHQELMRIKRRQRVGGFQGSS